MVVGSTVVDDDNGIWGCNRLSSNDTVALSDSILSAILLSADTIDRNDGVMKMMAYEYKLEYTASTTSSMLI